MKKSGVKILIIVLVILIIAAGGVLAYKIMKDKENNSFPLGLDNYRNISIPKCCRLRILLLFESAWSYDFNCVNDSKG